MRVLSLFDGISGAQRALKNLGIVPEIYFASEIDKYAIQITMKNFPNTIQLGDVRNITKEMVGEIDLMIWGSPCQDLSICKKDRKGLDGERSGLFWEALRIWKEVSPKYFLMENVASMPKEDKATISKELGVEPILINSSLLSAQQRKRLYWTNIPNVTQPEDQHIYLKDIIESSDVTKFIVSEKHTKAMMKTNKNFKSRDLEGKTTCLTSTYYKTPLDGNYIEVKLVKRPDIGKDNSDLDTLCIKALTEARTEQAKEMRRLIKKETGKDYCSRRDKELVPRNDDKANCLTTGQTKESLIIQDYIVRKLTPIECERLQTFPDSYTEGVSNTQRYKALGNSFTVKVIEHILSFMVYFGELF